jgi:hypothetical protein
MEIDGEFFCDTLEPQKDQSKGKPYSIPAGTYEVKLLPSFHFKEITPHLIDVPGFEVVEIHPGNYPKDTHGCTLVGSLHLENFVGNSKAVFTDLMSRLKEPISITYKDPA